MQTDARLVEHIHDARQPGADLSGQSNALALTTRERARTALERQVAESQIVENFKSRQNPFEEFLCNFGLCTCEFKRLEVTHQIAK